MAKAKTPHGAAHPKATAKKPAKKTAKKKPATKGSVGKVTHPPKKKTAKKKPIKSTPDTPVESKSPPATNPGASSNGSAAPLATQDSASVTASKGGLKVTAYRGDGSVMLAMNFDKKPEAGFAGFAIQCTPPGKPAFWLQNRLTFDSQITSATTPAQRHSMLTDSNLAPYQKFRWIDFSSADGAGDYKYSVSAMYHKSGGALEADAQVSVTIPLGLFRSGDLQIGFTRGLLSSQAYVDKFKNADIRPKQKSITYSTKPYTPQYTWLGYHARQLVFDFLDECLKDKQSTIDVFAYDLDEPDIIAQLVKFGPRLRAVLDDAPLHTKPTAMEPLAKKALIKSATAKNIKTGHFKRFSHCKVFIRKVNGKAVSVLTGSANFSVRGLYVQANNVLVFDDAETADHYETAFDQAFSDMSHFSSAEIAEGWIDMSHRPNLPNFAVAFSPHKSSSVSLDRVAQAVQNAKSSVLFAIMELGGSGPVLSQISALTAKRPDVFSYGVTQSLSGVKLYKPGSANGILTPFAYLSKHVPPPFDAEISGGAGQVIHDKFVITDFDTDFPSVFTGSSNLAAGGEEDNGDNLLAITDPAIASIYAVQAMGLVDHYHFRAVMQTATSAAPLQLDSTDKWWQDYYQPNSLKLRDRTLFCP